MTLASWIESQKRRLRSLGGALPRLEMNLFKRRNTVTKHIKSIRRLRSRLDPLHFARQDAVAGEPALAAERRTRYEHDLAVAFQSELDRTKSDALGKLREIGQSINRLPPYPQISNSEILGALEEAAFAEFRGSRDGLRMTQAYALSAKRKLNSFRAENRLFREAHHKRLMPAILGIVALVLLEGTVNYNYLVTQGVMAQQEAIIAVLVLALVNVVLSLLIGYVGLRNLHHTRTPRKVFGGLFSIAFSGLVIALHLLLANYRYELGVALANPNSSDAEILLSLLRQAMGDAANNVVEQPFAFIAAGDIDAMAVFAYGLMFALAAIIEGYALLEDRYPGYGEVTREYLRAEKRQSDSEDQFNKRIAHRISSAKSVLKSLSQAAMDRFAAVKTCIDDASGLMREYEEVASHIEETFSQLIRDYRDELVHVREIRPPEFWESDVLSLNRELPVQLDNFIQIEEREMAENSAIQQHIEELSGQLTTAQTELGARVREYLEEVDRDARGEDIALARLIGMREVAPG